MLIDFCPWCGKHITPFMFTKMAIKDKQLRRMGYWFCSLRCYTEWHRRFYTKRSMFDVQFEGNPLENMPENLPMLPE